MMTVIVSFVTICSNKQTGHYVSRKTVKTSRVPNLITGLLVKGHEQQKKSIGRLLVCSFDKETFIGSFCIFCLGVHVQRICIKTNCVFDEDGRVFRIQGVPEGRGDGSNRNKILSFLNKFGLTK
jgi:hypothetical protein